MYTQKVYVSERRLSGRSVEAEKYILSFYKKLIKTGCSYTAIELGDNFTEDMKNKFGSYNNFQIVNADFETYDFGKDKFDLVYSDAAYPTIGDIEFEMTSNPGDRLLPYFYI